MEKKNNYTISVYTENNVGLLHRLSAIFLKRHINIESFTTSECEIKDVFRFIIVVKMTKSGVEKVSKQIEKQVEVIRAFFHTDSETIFQESALYKMKSSSLFEEIVTSSSSGLIEYRVVPLKIRVIPKMFRKYL